MEPEQAVERLQARRDELRRELNVVQGELDTVRAQLEDVDPYYGMNPFERSVEKFIDTHKRGLTILGMVGALLCLVVSQLYRPMLPIQFPARDGNLSMVYAGATILAPFFLYYLARRRWGSVAAIIYMVAWSNALALWLIGEDNSYITVALSIPAFAVMASVPVYIATSAYYEVKESRIKKRGAQ